MNGRLACLLLGSNIQPERNLALGLEALRRHDQLQVERESSVWRSPSEGFAGPDFLNMALLVCTPLSAQALKARVLRPLEASLGRVRTANKYAPRTFDADVIIYDGQVLDEALWKRVFLAVPVAELLPDLVSPEGERLSDAAGRLARAYPIQLQPDALARR